MKWSHSFYLSEKIDSRNILKIPRWFTYYCVAPSLCSSFWVLNSWMLTCDEESNRTVMKSFRFRSYEITSYKNPFRSSKYFASQFAHFVPNNVLFKSYGFETGDHRLSVSDLICVGNILDMQHVWSDAWCHFINSPFWPCPAFRFQCLAFTRITFRTTYRESYYIYIYIYIYQDFWSFLCDGLFI